MNINPRDEEKLRATLQAWKTNAPLPTRFHEHVWSRIEQAEQLCTPSLLEAFGALLTRAFGKPALAGSYVATLLMIGLTAGYFNAQAKQDRLENQLATRYVQSVDPYLKISALK